MPEELDRPRCPRAQSQKRHLRLPRNRLISSPASPAPASRASRSTRSTPRASAATSSRSPRTRAIPRRYGEAGRRSDRGPAPRDLDRPEATRATRVRPRHRHRDLRLPAPPLRARRRAALPRLRAGRSPARAWRHDRRPDPAGCPRARASPSTPRSSATARASTARLLEELAPRGLHAREGVDGEQRLLGEQRYSPLRSGTTGALTVKRVPSGEPQDLVDDRVEALAGDRPPADGAVRAGRRAH